MPSSAASAIRTARKSIRVVDRAPSENHSVGTNRSQQSQSRQIQNVHLILEGDDLNPVGGWFAPTNPCVSLEASIATKSGSVIWQTVLTSEIQPNTVQKVRWKEMVVPVAQLLLGSCANTPLLNNSSYLEKKFNKNYLQKPIRIRVHHKDDENQPVGIPMGYMETTIDNLLQASGDATRSAPLWQEDGTAYGKVMVRHARLQTQKAPSRQSSVASRRSSSSLQPNSNHKRFSLPPNLVPSTKRKSFAKRTTSLTNNYRQTQSNHQRSKARRTQSHSSHHTSSGHRRRSRPSWHKSGSAKNLTPNYDNFNDSMGSDAMPLRSLTEEGGNASYHSSMTKSSIYSVPMDVLYQQASVFQLTLEGFDFLDMGGWLGTTNPYFQISIPTSQSATTPQHCNSNKQTYSFTSDNSNNTMSSSSPLLWQQVYRSEPVLDSLAPIWKSATIPLALLVGQSDCDDSQQEEEGQLDRTFRISFFSRYEAGSSEPPMSMGWLDTNILELKRASNDPTQELTIAEPITDTRDSSDSINPSNRKKEYGKIRVLQAELPEEFDVSVCSTSYSGSDGSMSIINSDVEVIEYGSSDDDSISIITHDVTIQTRTDLTGDTPGASLSHGGLEKMPEALVEEDYEEHQKSVETATNESGRHVRSSRVTSPSANESQELNTRSEVIGSVVLSDDLDMTNSPRKAQPRQSLGSRTLSLNTDIDSDASDHHDRSSYLSKNLLRGTKDFEESRGRLPSSRKSLLEVAASAAAQAVAASLEDLTPTSGVSSNVSKTDGGNYDLELKKCHRENLSVQEALEVAQESAISNKAALSEAQETLNTVRLENDVLKHNLGGRKRSESLHVEKVVEENECLVEELMKTRRDAESCSGKMKEMEQRLAQIKSEKEVLLEHNSSLTITMREIQAESDLRVSRLEESVSEKAKQIEEMRREINSLRIDKSALEISLSRAQQENQEAWERLRGQEENEIPSEARTDAQTHENNLAEIGMLDRRTLENILVEEQTKSRALEERLRTANAVSTDLRAAAIVAYSGEGGSNPPPDHEQTSNDRDVFSKEVLRLTESVKARDRLVERAREETIALQSDKESLQEALAREKLDSKVKLDQINRSAIESARQAYETSLETAEKKLFLYETSTKASASKISALSAENEVLTCLVSRLKKELSEISQGTNDVDDLLKARDKLAEELVAVKDTADFNIKQIQYEKDAIVNACRVLEAGMKKQESEIQRLQEFEDLCGLDVSEVKAHREKASQLQSEKEKLTKDLGTTQLKLAVVEASLEEKEAALLEKCDVIATLEDEKTAVEGRSDDKFELGKLNAARTLGEKKCKMLEEKVKNLEEQVTAAHFAKEIYEQYWKDANLKIKELQGTNKELKSIRKSIRLSTKGGRTVKRTASSKSQNSDDDGKGENSIVEEDFSGKSALEGNELNQGKEEGNREALETKSSRMSLKARRSTRKVEKDSAGLKIPTVQIQQMHESKVKRASLRVRRPSSALKKRPSSNTASTGDERPRKSRAERSSMRKSIRETKGSTDLSQPPTIRERKKRRSVSDTRKIRRSTTSQRKHRKPSSTPEGDTAEAQIAVQNGDTKREASIEPVAQATAESGAGGNKLSKLVETSGSKEESDTRGEDVAEPRLADEGAGNTGEGEPAGSQSHAGTDNDVGESIKLPRSELMKLI